MRKNSILINTEYIQIWQGEPRECSHKKSNFFDKARKKIYAGQRPDSSVPKIQLFGIRG